MPIKCATCKLTSIQHHGVQQVGGRAEPRVAGAAEPKDRKRQASDGARVVLQRQPLQKPGCSRGSRPRAVCGGDACDDVIV